jgi:putative glutamine amidotransferase
MNRKRPLIGITTDIKDGNFVIEDAYARAVAKAGGIPILIPSIPGNPEMIMETASRIDGLLLPGSRDMDPKFYHEEPHPKLRPMSIERTETEFAMLRETGKREIPVLGICGGMQLLNVFYGGSLYQDICSCLPLSLSHEKGAVHDVAIENESLLHDVIGANEIPVKSYHHQSVKDLGKGLSISARASDGIIEGIESEAERRILGIQWHPEREDSESSDRIFKWFIEICASR